MNVTYASSVAVQANIAEVPLALRATQGPHQYNQLADVQNILSCRDSLVSEFYTAGHRP